MVRSMTSCGYIEWWFHGASEWGRDCGWSLGWFVWAGQFLQKCGGIPFWTEPWKEGM
jgi:hypothetical protein